MEKHKFSDYKITSVRIDSDGDAEISLNCGEYCYLTKADTIAIARAQGVTAEDLDNA